MSELAPGDSPSSGAPAPRPAGYGDRPVPPGAFQPPEPGRDRGPVEYGGWWRRVIAALIDGAIVVGAAGLVLALLVLLGLSIDTGGGVAAYAGFALLVLVLLAIAALLYAPVLMARTDGQTLGKMAAGIRVVRAGGQSMDLAWAIFREVAVKLILVGVVSSFTFGVAALLDVLWPLWDRENRALHDFVCDTRVVRA